MSTPDQSLGLLVGTACLLEAKARKPGNVHPAAAFVDMTYEDFRCSGQAIAPIFAHASEMTVGQLILRSVQTTRNELGKNTNLGIILVLAPLAKARTPTPDAVRVVLDHLDREDAALSYEAIRLACPGGLGTAPEEDLQRPPTVTLLEAMRLAADRDLIARQYATGYHDLFSLLVPTLEHGLASGHALEQAIVHTHLTSLAELGDTLILRKCGPGVAEDARRQAREVLDRGWPVTPGGTQALCDYDRWLRAEGHRRNPGTTADLVAGALFLALRKGSIELPLTRPWDCPAL